VEASSVFLGTIDSAQGKLLFHARSNAVYTPGYILFVRDRTLMAQPFDDKQLEIRGQPFPIAEQVQYDESTWRGVFSSSFNGVLAYQGGNTGVNSSLVMLDRTGKQVRTIGAPGDFSTHKISPDGQRVAVGVLDASARNYTLCSMTCFGKNRLDLPLGRAEALSPFGRRTGALSDRKTSGRTTEHQAAIGEPWSCPITVATDR